MTADKASRTLAPQSASPTHHRPPPPTHNETARKYFHHSYADRINTNAVLVNSLRKEYPDLHLTVVPTYNTDIISFANAGHAGIAPIDSEKERVTLTQYFAPANRLGGGPGALGAQVKLGKYLVDWNKREYVMYIAECSDGTDAFANQTNQYLLSPSVDATNNLLLAAGQYNSVLHDEIYVFDGGFWRKSAELFDSVRKASWDDVILKEDKKNAIISDVETFFNSRETYERLEVPWKRGIIYHGPPGNGKTISIKAMMHTLYTREPPIPTLYVKTLSSFAGPEYSINEIFSRARSQAPCYLVFEDLDSLVNDEVRSFFLNAVDGIQKNDGILMLGSTNHLDRLDPGIAKRPSRFDRKYKFDNPDEEEREMYMKFWQRKLADNEDVEFPDKICPAVAKITSGFSFAYLQEAMVAALLALARDGGAEGLCLECLDTHDKPVNGSSCDRETVRSFKGLYDWTWVVRQVDGGDQDLDGYVLWRELKKQIRILREELGQEGNAMGRR